MEVSNGDCVRVAVNIRPLITPELLIGCTDCITVVPGEPQVWSLIDRNSRWEQELGCLNLRVYCLKNGKTI